MSDANVSAVRKKLRDGMTYSEKLKDPRWQDFRRAFIQSRKQPEGNISCDDCGEDPATALHVHHRRYIHGREPWDYDYGDLRLLCECCHDSIHETEQFARAFIIALPPHLMSEMRQVFEELNECRTDGLMKVALAHAKNAVRNINRAGEPDEEEYRLPHGGRE